MGSSELKGVFSCNRVAGSSRFDFRLRLSRLLCPRAGHHTCYPLVVVGAQCRPCLAASQQIVGPGVAVATT